MYNIVPALWNDNDNIQGLQWKMAEQSKCNYVNVSFYSLGITNFQSTSVELKGARTFEEIFKKVLKIDIV